MRILCRPFNILKLYSRQLYIFQLVDEDKTIFCVLNFALIGAASLWARSEPLRIIISACPQAPISGLGPDGDQCPRKVPKEARFASQVPKFTNVILNCVLMHWYHVYLLLSRLHFTWKVSLLALKIFRPQVQGSLFFSGRPVGWYYQPLVNNRPYCLNGRYSWICGRYYIKLVDIS